MGGVLEIVPGTEGALSGTGEDSDPGIIVVAKTLPSVGQFVCGGRVNSVEPLGPVYRDGNDAVAVLVGDELVRHRVLPGVRMGER